MTSRQPSPSKMLSRAEILFFRGEKKVGKDYERMIRGRTTAKIRQLRKELTILALDPKINPVLEEALRDVLQPENPGRTQDEQKTVREQNCVRQNRENWRARWDLNPGSPASQADAVIRTWPRALFSLLFNISIKIARHIVNTAVLQPDAGC